MVLPVERAGLEAGGLMVLVEETCGGLEPVLFLKAVPIFGGRRREVEDALSNVGFFAVLAEGLGVVCTVLLLLLPLVYLIDVVGEGSKEATRASMRD